MSDRKNRNRNPAVREIVITAIAATAVLVTALASKLIADATSFPFAVVLVLFLLLFSSAALLLLNFRRKRKRDDGTEALRTEHNNIFEMTRKLANPAVICDKQGAILWYNDAFLSAADSSAKQATTVKELFPHSAHLLAGEGERGGVFMLGSRTYKCATYELSSHDKSFVLLLLNDISELAALREEHKNEQPVVVYIRIDNLEEMQQYLKEKHRAA